MEPFFSGCWNCDQLIVRASDVVVTGFLFSCRIGMFRPPLMRTLQVDNMNQNCDMTNCSSSNTSKSYRYPVKTESLPERWGAMPPMPSCHLNKTTNKFQRLSKIHPPSISVIQPMTKSTDVCFKEWSWQRKFFTWLGELLAGSGPKWRVTSNPMEKKLTDCRHERNRLLASLFCVFFWRYQKERSYSLRVLGVCVV